MTKLVFFNYGPILENMTDNYILGLIDEGQIRKDWVVLASA